MGFEFNNPLDALIPTIMEAAAEWEKENTPDVIKQKVKVLLDKHHSEMFLALAGFEYSFGKLQLKSSQKDSPAYELIREAVQGAVKELMNDLPKLTISATAKKQIHSDLTAEFRYLVGQEVRQQAKTYLKEEAAELINEMLKSALLEKVIKTKALIKA